MSVAPMLLQPSTHTDPSEPPLLSLTEAIIRVQLNVTTRPGSALDSSRVIINLKPASRQFPVYLHGSTQPITLRSVVPLSYDRP